MKRKRMIGAIGAALVALSVGSVAVATEKATAEKAPAKAATTKRTGIKKEREITVNATVQAIDLEKRVVTLKGAEGKVFDVKVGPEARNLPQLEVGDNVAVTYYESIAYRLLKPGEAAVPSQQAAVMDRAKEGDKPGAMAAEAVTLTATIEAIDKKAKTATLKGPNGKSITVKAQDPKNLEHVKVGDEVVITYTEAVAISVTPAKK
jgi:glucose/arabinose dehydrogenase